MTKPPLVDLIESFNRKERHILWEQATGTGERVRLSDTYRDKLSAALELDVPPDALVLVDYHLNWLYGALLIHTGQLTHDGVHAIPGADGERRPYERNQEDIDLLVVFEQDGTTFVVLVEAKAFTWWGNTQMGSKLTRLDSIIADTVPDQQDVQFRLVLTSFEKAKKLDLDWGSWGNESGPVHVPLEKVTHRTVIAECGADGLRKADGGYIHLESS